MPASTSRPKSKKTKPATRPSWTSRMKIQRYGRPLIFALSFMFVGAGSLFWASAATTSYGIWNNSKVPKILAADDRHDLELGMKFKPSVSGHVEGVRFYKAAQNTGTHTGSLWSERGRLLATVAFKNETKSGWQTAKFDTPVSVAANVTYVVSYHAPKGRYSVDFEYFNKQSYKSGDLTAQKATRYSANGVYRYGSQTRFPNQDGSGANYWVDVVFNTKRFNPPTAPAAPANLTANLQGKKTVLLNWQASASAEPIVRYEVFRNGGKIAETANTNYADNAAEAGKAYEYTVKAVDTTGTASSASPKASIQVPAEATNPSPGGGDNNGGNSNGGTGGSGNTGNTGGTGTGTSTNLFDPSKKELAMRLVSSAENSSLNWRAQYAYIQDIGDGRGYTAGIIGFCSGTGDMLEMVQYYTSTVPNNILAKYLPALQKVNGTDSHTGLGNTFVADWKTAAADPKFQAAQDYQRDTMYFNPAVNQGIADGLKALGQFIYYDAIVMHGPGSDPVSFGGIRAAAVKKAKTPAQGGNETTYLNAFLDARKAAMLTEAAHENTDRVDTEQRVFLQAGNLDLDVPLRWSVYGDQYEILTKP